MTCPRKKQGGYSASAGSGCLACFSGDSSAGAASPVFARFIGDTGAMEWIRLAVPWPRAPAAAPDRPAPSPRGCTPLANVGTGRKARRAGGGSAKRTFRFQRSQLADAKYARLKRPVLEDAPPLVAARQLLLRRGLLGDQVSVTRERRYIRLRRRCSGVERRRRTMPRRRWV